MGLGDRSLGAGFMNQTFGANSTPDEMEYMKLRASDGGKFGVSSFYEETGSMPIAKTLARHYKKGGRRYEDGGTSGGDPWEYKMDGDKVLTRKKGDSEWIVTEGDVRENILKTQFPDEYNKNSESESYSPYVNAPSETEAESAPAPGDTSAFIPDGTRNQNAGKDDNSNNVPYAPTYFSEGRPNMVPNQQQNITNNGAPINEDFSEFDKSAELAASPPSPPPPAKAAVSNNRLSKYVDPRIASKTLTDIENSGMQGTPGTMSDPYKLDTSIIGNTVIPEVATPDLGPNWWDENRSNIARGASNVGAGFLNVAPHLGNIKRYNNMPGVRAPNLSKTVKTEAPSFESSRQAIIAQGNNAANRAQGQSQSNQLASNISSMAGTQSALSQLGGQEAQAVAANDARNAQASNQNNARNTQVLNKNLEQQTSRELAQIRGISNEWGNIANKSLGFVGDINRQKLDRERMDLTRQAYNQQGQLDRAALKQFEETGILPEYYRPTNKNSNG